MSPMRDGRTNDERTREDRATQPMEAGWLSFAILILVKHINLLFSFLSLPSLTYFLSLSFCIMRFQNYLR